jgi:hypothetical protein
VAVSVLAGAAEDWVMRYQRGHALIFCLAAVAACVVAALPLLDPLPWSDFGAVSAVRVVKAGLDWMPGTTATNEFLPVTVLTVPAPQPELIQSYETNQVDKVNRAALPEGAEVILLDHGPEHDRWHISGPTPFTLHVYTFYFPGWKAYLDGVETPITASRPEGWITLPVPAGDHEIRLRFENTFPGRLGWGISGIAAISLILVLIRGRRPVPRPAVESLSRASTMALSLVVIVGLCLRYGADQYSWWRLKPEADNTPLAQYESFVALESNIILIGYDLPRTSGKPGDHIPFILYWEAQTPVTRNLRVFVHVIGPDGQLWGQSDRLRPGGFDSLPTGRWPLYRPVRDEHEAILRSNAPPGDYRIIAGLWDGYTGERMHVLDADGNVTDQDGVVLTTDFVVQP